MSSEYNESLLLPFRQPFFTIVIVAILFLTILYHLDSVSFSLYAARYLPCAVCFHDRACLRQLRPVSCPPRIFCTVSMCPPFITTSMSLLLLLPPLPKSSPPQEFHKPETRAKLQGVYQRTDTRCLLSSLTAPSLPLLAHGTTEPSKGLNVYTEKFRPSIRISEEGLFSFRLGRSLTLV